MLESVNMLFLQEKIISTNAAGLNVQPRKCCEWSENGYCILSCMQNKENVNLENFSHVPSQSISTANSSRGSHYHDYFHHVFVLPVLKIHISKLYDMNCLYKASFYTA